MTLLDKFFGVLACILTAALLGAWGSQYYKVSPEPYWRLGSMNIYRAVDSQTDVACYVLTGGGERAQLSCATYRLRAGAVGDPNDIPPEDPGEP